MSHVRRVVLFTVIAGAGVFGVARAGLVPAPAAQLRFHNGSRQSVSVELRDGGAATCDQGGLLVTRDVPAGTSWTIGTSGAVCWRRVVAGTTARSAGWTRERMDADVEVTL